MLAPPEKQSPQPQKLSVREPPEYEGLTYQWERLAPIAREIAPLFRRHWREIALNQDNIALDPDWSKYLDCELVGLLHVLTVRSGGVLVGYIFCFVGPHLHYVSTTWCLVDMFWLDPGYRFAWTGVKLFREMERGIKERGAKIVHASEKLHFHNWNKRTVSAIFRRLGYTPIETVWSKNLGA